MADNTEPENQGKVGRYFSLRDRCHAGLYHGRLSMEYVSLSSVFPLYPVLCVCAYIIGFRGIKEVPYTGVRLWGCFCRVRALWRNLKLSGLCYIFFTYAGFFIPFRFIVHGRRIFSGVLPGHRVNFCLVLGLPVISFSGSGMVSERSGENPC